MGVYPRVYGETQGGPTETPEDLGLSPRVRGNRRDRAGQGLHPGSIPACTGKPGRHNPVRGHAKVYPRVYGETCGFRRPGDRVTGLSPRVRGNPSDPRPPHRSTGSIPACTGKPTSALIRPWESRVYPRVYGETHFADVDAGSGAGLSPRVRGNQCPSHRICMTQRSIPACTGKPGPAMTE